MFTLGTYGKARFFPKSLSNTMKIQTNFSLAQSHFILHGNKVSSMRGVLSLQYQILAFTLEISLAGAETSPKSHESLRSSAASVTSKDKSNRQNPYLDKHVNHGNGRTGNYHYNSNHLQDMGGQFCQGLLKMFEHCSQTERLRVYNRYS